MPTTERQIGRYVLLEKVGRGAMGVVYRAEDPAIHRTVAVKILHTPEDLTPEQVRLARERFLREGQAAGSIDHPNIIRVFDVGEDRESGEMYIVMEFVPGPSLDAVLDREETLGLESAVALVGQIASGLDAAHARGIVHRDIKPSNILLTDDFSPKIADFGITYVAASVLTQDMRELGTPAYMSPEHLTGKVLDARADLFSLGVLTYEILAGRKPFAGTDIVSMAHAIAYEPPLAISVANPDLPRGLDDVMELILAKKPADRFGSGKEFHDALCACLRQNAPASAPAVPRGARQTAWAVTSIAVLTAAIAVLLWRGTRSGSAIAKPLLPAPVPSQIAAAAPPPEAQASPKTIGPAAPPVQKKESPKPGRKAAQAPSVTPAPAATKSRAPARAVAPESRPAAAKPPVVVPAVPPTEVTVSFAHRMRKGTLVVDLDGKPIFDEKFAKSKLALVQTTIWDPLRAPAGGHTVVAKVTGEDGKSYISDSYPVEFASGQKIELHIGLKGDALTVKPSPGAAE